MCADVSICQEYELTNGTCVLGTKCKQDYQGYMFNDSFPKKCLTSAECTNIEKYYVDNDNNTCVHKAACMIHGLVFEDGDSKECLKNEARCLEKDGYYAYVDDVMRRRYASMRRVVPSSVAVCTESCV